MGEIIEDLFVELHLIDVGMDFTVMYIHDSLTNSLEEQTPCFLLMGTKVRDQSRAW